MTFEGMPSRRVYTKAPIVEAVIDVKAKYEEPDAVLDRLTALADLVAEKFPSKTPIERVFVDARKKTVGEGPPQPARQQLGWKLVGAKNDRVLQLSKMGFTYSHLPPYTRWEVFQEEASSLWDLFLDRCKPIALSRVAVRYINRLKLPPGDVELSDYLNYYPRFPDGAVPLIAGVMMQVQAPQPSIPGNGNAIITLASEDQRDPSFQPMVLDLDVFTEIELDPRSGELWTVLGELRDKKNVLFEAVLTDKMKGTFE